MFKEFPFSMNEKMKKKLDILISSLDKNDVWLIIDGDEGSGKTNTAAYILYYVHCMTGREFTLDRFYFDSADMFNWVKDHENGLINWDEAALGGLSADWFNQSQKNILKFAMTGRKKHHFFVLCIPKIKKLAEYLRVDRSHGLIHMDLGKHKDRYGNCMWITRRGKAALNTLWTKKKFLGYQQCMRKYGGFYAYIPHVFPKLLDEKAYDKKKDKAISEIGTKKGSDKEEKLAAQLDNYKEGMYIKLRNNGWTQEKIAELYGVHKHTIQNIAKKIKEKRESLEKPAQAHASGELFNNSQES